MERDPRPASPEHLARIRDRITALRAACAPRLAGPPFTWEVGCGHGHFLAAYAAAHPGRLCVGIDVNPERIGRAERKRDRAGLSNLVFLRAEARDFLAALPPAARFAAIYLLFPDPWPKRRHRKNRLLGPEFLRAAAERAERGVRLYFRTDDESYHAAAAAAIAAHPSWRLDPSAAWPFENPTIFQEKAARYHSLVAERM